MKALLAEVIHVRNTSYVLLANTHIHYGQRRNKEDNWKGLLRDVDEGLEDQSLAKVVTSCGRSMML